MQRVAVITGSSSGIGCATVSCLAADGYCVVLHARTSLTELQVAAAEALKLGAPAAPCVLADVTNRHVRQNFVQAAFHWQGRVDAWVNNAGADVLTTDSRQWDFESKLELLLATDLQATVHLSRDVSARMRGQTSNFEHLPAIINIGWDQAWLGMEGRSIVLHNQSCRHGLYK